MKKFCSLSALAVVLLFGLAGDGLAQATTSTSSSETTKTKSKFEQAIDGKKKIDADGKGMWTLYHNEQQLLAEIPKSSLSKEYIVITSIARGISSGMVIGGMSWNFGDDAIWTFRQSGEKLFVVQRNVRYRAKAGSPEASAVELAYSDSILYALPIITTAPGGGLVVDLTRIFMSDDQQIGQAIGPGFSFMSDRSTWAKVKTFEKNVELQVAAVYGGRMPLATVPDSRGVQVHVHYSIAELPRVGSNGYKPRLADDRIGYFLSAVKDFSVNAEDEHFVRYINRWNLQKLDDSAELSPPKEPIVFCIEKTTPIALRPTIEAGILEWNKAFEKIGFSNAIRVEHEEDIERRMGFDIDPEDVRYNFFRWITADAGFAMGPSRIDPRTGQILDADIIFDAGFLNYWKQDYETFTPEDSHRLNPNWSPSDNDPELRSNKYANPRQCACCQYGHHMQQQMGFSAALMATRGEISAEGKLPKEFIHQGLKEVVMHEVGHTLGLRHNFKASTWKSLADIGKSTDPTVPTVGSVMDYTPPNIVKKGGDQGLYFPQTLGPYDHWAIEYGYKSISGDEAKELAKIASRSGEPGLDYATDEDTRSIDADPHSNRFDLGDDPVAFVRRQMEHAAELIPEVVDRTVKEGEGYQRARRAFGLLISEYWRSAIYASRFPGGLHVHRDHKGDKNARPPFVVVDSDKQRAAMKLIQDSVFSVPEYKSDLLNYLAASRWSHWGQNDLSRLDYPIHEITLQMQSMILSQLLNGTTLSRLSDNETKVGADKDAYTLAEHFRLIVDGVFGDLEAAGKPAPKSEEDGEEKEKPKVKKYTDRKPLVDSYRRNLQRETLKSLANLVIRPGFNIPADARTLTRMHLVNLKDDVNAVLKSETVELDDYSRAHLIDLQARIEQFLNAQLTVPSVN